jgi:glycosyltransferase involved in cell wall biosynthesis
MDAQLAAGTATGIGEYVTGLTAALRTNGVAVVELAQPAYDPWRFDRRVVWDQLLLPRAARRAHADLLHCAAGTMPLRASLPIVVTVHDVAWLRVQRHARAYARLYFGAFQVARYASAARVVVDSHFSRAELLALTRVDPALVDVVYPGVAADVAALERRAEGEPLVLAVGTVERRKNLEVLIRALPGVPAARLVSVGPLTPYGSECRALAASLGVADRLELRGYVSRAELLALYGRAALVAMPSRYEGFGYGAAQALCAGVPLVAADAASLPEIVAGAAALVDPADPGAWTAALQTILADPEAAGKRAAAARPAARERFTWQAAARAMEAVYRRALEPAAARRPGG